MRGVRNLVPTIKFLHIVPGGSSNIFTEINVSLNEIWSEISYTFVEIYIYVYN